MTSVQTRPAALAISFLALATVALPNAYAAAASELVDLRFGLCDTPAKVERALELHPKGASFNVWLFDDPALELFAKGLRIRLRETKQGAELTLKAADQDCTNLPPVTVSAGEGKCEYDLHGTKITGVLSLTRLIDVRTANGLANGHLPLANELSPAQKRFLQGVGAWPLPSGTRALGPTQVRSYRTKKMSYAVDMSELPDGERFIEISRKVSKAESSKARAQFEADLLKAGVPVCADQSAQAINKLRALLLHP